VDIEENIKKNSDELSDLNINDILSEDLSDIDEGELLSKKKGDFDGESHEQK
jgi:hypothetical protein